MAKAPQDRSLDRTNLGLGYVGAEGERLEDGHTGLGDHPCPLSTMWPGCRMHQEWVTDIDVAGGAHGQNLLTLECGGRQSGGHATEPDTLLAERDEDTGYVEV